MARDSEIIGEAFQAVRNKAYAEGYGAGYAKAIADAAENLSKLKAPANLPKPAGIVDSIDESSDLTYETSVEALEIDDRIRGCFERAGIRTIGDLLLQSRDDLLRLPKFGTQSLGTIIVELRKHDIALRGDRL